MFVPSEAISVIWFISGKSRDVIGGAALEERGIIFTDGLVIDGDDDIAYETMSSGSKS